MKKTVSIICVVLLTVVSNTVSVRAEPGTDANADTLDTTALRQQAEKLQDVRDYEMEIVMSIGMTGINFEITQVFRALAPHYAYVELTVPMRGQTFMLCDGDSVWTFTGSSKTYYAEPWSPPSDTELGQDFDSDLGAMMTGQIPPFSFLSVLLKSELDGQYLSDGTEELQLDDQPTMCEVWHRQPVAGEDALTTLWVDPATNLVRRTYLVAEASMPTAQRITLELTRLKTDIGLTPDDFKFTPREGYRRVAGAGERFVTNPSKGKTLADFELKNLSGDQVRSDDWRGRIVVLDFWATWCAPCRKTLPHLQKLAREYGDKVQVIGVTSEKPATVQAFFAEAASPYPILIDPDEKVSGMYEVESLPTLFVLDAQGKIVGQVVGAQTESDLRAMIDGVLQD